MHRCPIGQHNAAISHCEARAAQRCPEVVDHLASEALTLASVFVLAPHLDGDAGPALVVAACGKSRREVERQMVDRFGEPPRGGNVQTKPLAQGMTRLEITITERCEALLREASDLDGHRKSDMAEVLEQALADYVEKRKAACHGQVKNPQKAPRPCDADRVSTQAKRVVYERDGGRCSFVGKAGHRCTSTYQLEYDHVQPRAHGGSSGAGNLRLLCRVHNNYVAEEVIGVERGSAARARAELVDDCTLALTTLGFSKREAKKAVATLRIEGGSHWTKSCGLRCARRNRSWSRSPPERLCAGTYGKQDCIDMRRPSDKAHSSRPAERTTVREQAAQKTSPKAMCCNAV